MVTGCLSLPSRKCFVQKWMSIECWVYKGRSHQKVRIQLFDSLVAVFGFKKATTSSCLCLTAHQHAKPHFNYIEQKNKKVEPWNLEKIQQKRQISLLFCQKFAEKLAPFQNQQKYGNFSNFQQKCRKKIYTCQNSYFVLNAQSVNLCFFL